MSFKYVSRDKVEEFVLFFSVCFNMMTKFIVVKPYTKGNRVFMNSGLHICIRVLFKELDIMFPFSHMSDVEDFT